jgi:hypothetical protein
MQLELEGKVAVVTGARAGNVTGPTPPLTEA